MSTASPLETERAVLPALRLRLFGIPPHATSFSVRGFDGGSLRARRTLEGHASSFVRGFNAAVARDDVGSLAATLDQEPDAERGLAYEGAAMGWALLDLLTPRGGQRLARLLRGPGQAHVYMVHVGAGWALARLRLRPRSRLAALDPFLRWLALDGYGFHDGFFAPRRCVAGQRPARRLRGYERRAFDQGLGRSLWFSCVGDVERAAGQIAAFSPERHADLWSGLALAATYTTVAERTDLEQLKELGEPHRAELAQGAAFAVLARHRADNVVPGTHTAAAVLCERSVDEVALAVESEMRGSAADLTGAAYEQLRRRVGERLSAPPRGAP